MDFLALLGYLIGLAVVAVIILCAVLYWMSETYPSIASHKSEDFFNDPSSGKKLPFPSITDKPSKSLTVVVPAYNEEKRLPLMLEESLTYLEERAQKDNAFTYEMIIVDDGSKDKTTEVAMGYTNKFGCDKVRILTLAWNRGKGGAVRMGMFRARGKLLLFADADGATTFPEYGRVEASLRNRCKEESEVSEALVVSCGSRAHLEEESVASRSVFRTVLMYGFHALVWVFAVRGVRDTQCGFKLLTRRAGRILFNSLHVERWAFDVEMLYLAQSLGITIDEVAVEWNEIEGTKMTPVLSWLEMGLDLFTIWLRYTLGAWRIRGDMKK
ncbi:Dolichyl-phosphate beta-glucosyltransferase [Chionoecetes opilio]|uniref:Dolichyl-phosphate beta-glucosyltransferase n=1 Tax=Chionoecetes opilio TaxID=41210 RepID=A0A8J4YKZ5_CHIOP|nr:Dolichyl-phosphate beta-glucosyltransferase [Chionoecetes opilio]